MSVELSKPRLAIGARALNERFRHVLFNIDTVARVADVMEEGIFMRGLDDRSGFLKLSLQPERELTAF